jgi:anti-anti-sigma factor
MAGLRVHVIRLRSVLSTVKRMNTELADDTRQGTAPQKSLQTRAGAELRVGIHPGAPPQAAVHGEIDISTSPWLREDLLSVILRHGPELVLDLGGVTFMDCTGINLLLATRRRARLAGGWLQVINAAPAVTRIIALTGLRQVLTPSADHQVRAMTREHVA